ncbi:ABC transporter substrate-binding protein [Corynebacterium lowii]|uniref:Corrinoid ABC transporter substrate-binding protein n=1 Tax=Corynebacterium lowii TaxID=1544413 RepID=A0A0Q0YKB8_9CORY|nr:ABC transporter substrate-binding protein [Corynebacterium lowii]KQB87321.1 corrinoid ABC transporter substrate-binding protein [Corynebacterium lowii]MDP9852091.1 iron complex transport system substrate-binding protein [Corynebacterium lowii]
MMDFLRIGLCTVRRPARTVVAVGTVALSLGLSACAGGGTQTQEAAEAGGNYPVTVHNCGQDVTFTAPPSNALLLDSAPVSTLSALGVLGSVSARAGAYPEQYYTAQENEQLAAMNSLTDQVDGTGHIQLSKDVVLAQGADAVFGHLDNVDRESLDKAGIPEVIEPIFCHSRTTPASMEDVYEQVNLYGEIYGVTDKSEQVNEGLRERVAAATERAQADTRPDKPTTAAVLYPTVGGGATFAYGQRSMATPQLEAAGMSNVFGDMAERVAEINVEELIRRDPDVIVLLHSTGDPAQVAEALKELPGADELRAVREGNVMVQLMNYTEPGTPLTVQGLENIVERFHP